MSNSLCLHDGSYIRELILDGSMRNEKCVRKSPKVSGSPEFLSNIGIFRRVQHADFFTNWCNKLNNGIQHRTRVKKACRTV